jgi:hypothetical protein
MSKMGAYPPYPAEAGTLVFIPGNLKAGGASRDRTDDLKLAKLALSQLSYGPMAMRGCWRKCRAQQLLWWAE